jgi:spoIIIJ-associated protein
MATKKNAKRIEELANSILEGLGVSATAKVFEVDEFITVEIDGKDSSILIGYHGETLRSIRHLLTAIIKKQIDPDLVISVDISGYLARKEEKIKEIAQKAIDKVEHSGASASLPSMSSYERRIAHGYITEQGFSSTSEGEGFQRHIVVSK